MSQQIKIGDVVSLNEIKTGTTKTGKDWMLVAIHDEKKPEKKISAFVLNVDEVKNGGWAFGKIVDMIVTKGSKKTDTGWAVSWSVSVKLTKEEVEEGFINAGMPELPFE